MVICAVHRFASAATSAAAGLSCLCAIEPRQDGRLSLAGPMGSSGDRTGGAPAPPPDRRLPSVDCATYGSVFVP